MEIINAISQTLIAFAGIAALILMLMLFAWFLGQLMSNIFEG